MSYLILFPVFSAGGACEDGVYGIPSPISGIVYIELIDDEGNFVERSR